ncbi:hypothetical protein DENIS_4957 [Desulfonema ishimotonii]|uniref:Uncharacterized protein n=1 Tax=Desulfonema ishimotonii TaxID=45657 RepID=A0A401G3Z0_9BACT|nr:hypothetical protein DENIS_4957 [Desulfonema ishimotonii]
MICTLLPWNGGFNPRARMGRDKIRFAITGEAASFNPRARMGRDNENNYNTVPQGCFNPRARMGRDIMGNAQILKTQEVSIHAPAWGATKK